MLDGVDHFVGFDPRQHYAATLRRNELTDPGLSVWAMVPWGALDGLHGGPAGPAGCLAW